MNVTLSSESVQTVLSPKKTLYISVTDKVEAVISDKLHTIQTNDKINS